YNESRNAVYRVRLTCCRKTAVWAIIPSLIYGLQLLYSYYASAQLLTEERIDVGDFVVYASALFSLTMMLSDLVEKFVSVKAEGKYLEALLECITEYGYHEEEEPESCEMQSFETIEFSHVYFSYFKDDNYALKDLCTVIHAGEKISIVGENGSGKSTFIKLLLGLYTPIKGSILIDGKDLREISQKTLRKLFAPVFQDFATTSYTIAENVSLNEKIDADKVRSSLKRAGVIDKINSLPKGTDTSIYFRLDPEGTELSGGELQKLAMARAYYKNAPILVLDEPTAALSPQAEKELYQKVWHESGTQTVFFISHRLSSCCESERILVFRNGKLIEEGDHNMLMQENGHYCKLFETQAEHYR
ncbi:ABC transporter ATP-binding protein, partial [Ruminococcus sp.]|uniref:ABC transporter ATP-binding protein n=1 Tax=Ruminococcus sp. TaxID=41978 RepID=UPI00258B49C2